MGNTLKEYLTFTKKERRGLLFLLSLIVLVIVYLNLDLDSKLKDDTDMSEFESELAALTKASADQRSSYSWKSEQDEEPVESAKKSGPYVFHEFDPNFVTDEEWRDMGLKNWQVNGIRNYREKAGDFESPEQFARLNVVTDEFFEKVQPYLVFEAKKEALERKQNNKQAEEKEKEVPLSIELNSASAESLKRLKGIGPAYSNRIVKYRNWLGGFLSLDQLLEVYGLEDSLYREIVPFLTLDTNRISRININTVMINELGKHPYVKWNVATAIVNYRDQHGPYKTVADIKKTDLVSSDLYRKIAPYFSLSNN